MTFTFVCTYAAFATIYYVYPVHQVASGLHDLEYNFVSDQA